MAYGLVSINSVAGIGIKCAASYFTRMVTLSVAKSVKRLPMRRRAHRRPPKRSSASRLGDGGRLNANSCGPTCNVARVCFQNYLRLQPSYSKLRPYTGHDSFRSSFVSFQDGGAVLHSRKASNSSLIKSGNPALVSVSTCAKKLSTCSWTN